MKCLWVTVTALVGGLSQAIGSNPAPYPSRPDREQEGEEWSRVVSQLSEELPTPAFLSLDKSHQCSPGHMAAGKARHWHSHTTMLVQECQQCYSKFLHHSKRGHAHIWCMETPSLFPQQSENPSGQLQVQDCCCVKSPATILGFKCFTGIIQPIFPSLLVICHIARQVQSLQNFKLSHLTYFSLHLYIDFSIQDLRMSTHLKMGN